jgi:heat shock protein HslJ
MKKIISGSLIALLLMTASPAAAEVGGTITLQVAPQASAADKIMMTVLELFTWNSSIGQITFDDGRYAANAGCNNISGAYSLRGKAVDMSAPVATLMFCDGKMQNEAALITLLDTATVLTFKDGGFVLSNGSTTTYFAATLTQNTTK